MLLSKCLGLGLFFFNSLPTASQAIRIKATCTPTIGLSMDATTSTAAAVAVAAMRAPHTQ